MISVKNHSLKRGEKMESESAVSAADPEETDSDDEFVEIFTNYSGVKLIYFEHSYAQNWASLCEMYENSKLIQKSSENSEKVTMVQENINTQGPVRRSQRQINKSEKDVSSSVNIEKTNNIESPIKSKVSIEEKSKENIDMSETNMHLKNLIAAKKMSSKNENKTVSEIPVNNTKLPVNNTKMPVNNTKMPVNNTKMPVNNTKVSHKEDVINQITPSKVLKKIKISETKVIMEKEQDADLKRKTSGKEDFNSIENGELKKKDKSSAFAEAKRKRAFSDPSTEGTSLDNVEKEIAKSKRFRIMAKQRSPQKMKKSDKMNIESTKFKKRKRNMSAPSNKTAGLKNEDKNFDTSIKGRRKKCMSLSEEPVKNNTAKIENKKRLSVDVKTPTSKVVSPASNSPVKPKFKKNFRRESLRLVINEDEPPLFSQPDVMVKVKSDDTAIKKEEKVDTEEKNQEQNDIDNLNKSDHPVPEKVPSVEPKIKSQEIDQKSPEKLNEVKVETKVETKVEIKVETKLETKVEAKDVVPENNLDAAPVVSDYFCEKDDFKDIDSENSLHIDESVGKIYEGENDDYSKDESTESTCDSSVVKDNSLKHQKNDLINAEPQDNTNLQSSVKDSDSDKPIAERKPRRIIKKKEFFEEITARSSTQTKKSGGKKGNDKKGNDEDSKQGKKSANHKSEAESDEESEDDPLKLWCICRQPHNDRFMIQCDRCEDWFHGSCVGVSRQQGRKLEKQQKEWNCPNCLAKGPETPKTENVVEKKLELEEKKVKSNGMKEAVEDKVRNNQQPPKKEKGFDKMNKTPLKSLTDKPSQAPPHTKSDTTSLPPSSLNKKGVNKNVRNISKGSDPPSNHKKGLKEPIKRKQNCIVCQAAAAANSCYCGEKCLEKHATDCLNIMREGKGALKGSDFDAQRVVVLDRVKGSVIAGDNAPTAGNIVAWLKANPSFMIACSSSASAGSKKESPVQKKEDLVSSLKEKKEASDESSKATVRFNVRKTLKNILMDRCKNADDIQLPEEEIRKIAVKIEEELHSLFKDNSFKYRAKYRSLMFNIKDPRNQGLFRKILKGNIPPDKLVRMSPEELASMELAKWREQENQHLLDMIKRVQLEQQSGSCLLLKKTHKGEVEIEDDFTNIIDDIPKASKSYPGESAEVEKPEPDKEVVKDTTHHHRSHLFDLNCKICTGKILPPPVEENTPKKIRVAHSISVDLSSPAAIDPVEKTISRIVDGKSPLSSAGDDSLDQEPTSTVSIGSPETPVRYVSDTDASSKLAVSVWKGFIYMQDVAKFVTSAYKVSGQTDHLHLDVPDTIHVCGRIIPDQVWDYLGKIKQSGNKELIIVRFQAANDEEASTYNSFYSYLSSRKRYGVVSNYSKKIKDFYILPLAATSPVPIVLMPFDGPGLPSPRPHLLLGVIVRHKVKQTGVPVSKKEKCKEEVDRLDGSYTPPLETRSYTPPLPALQTDSSLNVSPDTAYSPSIDLKSTASSEESDITQNSIASCTDILSKNDSEIYEPSYTPPLQILSSDSPKDRDDDKPYDPEQDILNIAPERKDSKSSPKEDKHASTENLEKHKKILDALTRQVEETDRQVNALKQLISHPDDSDAEFHSPGNQMLDINSVTASGMSSFLDLPENLQDILNVVREKSIVKDKLATSKSDVDMRINNLFNKSFSTSVDKFSSTFQSLESGKVMNSQEKNLSGGATPPLDDNEEISPVVRPSDPRIKLRTNFQESFSSEEPANVSLSNMSVSELVERAEKELAEMEALDQVQTSNQSVSGQEKIATSNIDKMSSSCWSQFKEPPPPGIELPDLTQESTYSSKTVPSTSTSDSSLPSSYSSSLIQDAQPPIGSHFPPPALPSTFPHLPPGFSIQTPPPNIKNFPPPNVISTSFPPPPLPLVSKSSDANSASETWSSWNIPPPQSKDNTWQNRVPQWDENWKSPQETAPAESESNSHFYSPASHEFHKEQFYRGESSSESRWSRPSQRFGRNNWNKRPLRGGRWRGRRSFHFNKNQRN